MLDLHPPEVETVAVNSVFELHCLLPRPGGIDKVLSKIKAMKQDWSGSGRSRRSKIVLLLLLLTMVAEKMRRIWAEMMQTICKNGMLKIWAI